MHLQHPRVNNAASCYLASNPGLLSQILSHNLSKVGRYNLGEQGWSSRLAAISYLRVKSGSMCCRNTSRKKLFFPLHVHAEIPLSLGTCERSLSDYLET